MRAREHVDLTPERVVMARDGAASNSLSVSQESAAPSISAPSAAAKPQLATKVIEGFVRDVREIVNFKNRHITDESFDELITYINGIVAPVYYEGADACDRMRAVVRAVNFKRFLSILVGLEPHEDSAELTEDYDMDVAMVTLRVALLVSGARLPDDIDITFHIYYGFAGIIDSIITPSIKKKYKLHTCAARVLGKTAINVSVRGH